MIEVANFNSKGSEENELQRGTLKGDVCRSEEKLIVFFADSALNKSRIVKISKYYLGVLSHCFRLSHFDKQQ